jgi:hypothetical protein
MLRCWVALLFISYSMLGVSLVRIRFWELFNAVEFHCFEDSQLKIVRNGGSSTQRIRLKCYKFQFEIVGFCCIKPYSRFLQYTFKYIILNCKSNCCILKNIFRARNSYGGSNVWDLIMRGWKIIMIHDTLICTRTTAHDVLICSRRHTTPDQKGH